MKFRILEKQNDEKASGTASVDLLLINFVFGKRRSNKIGNSLAFLKVIYYYMCILTYNNI